MVLVKVIAIEEVRAVPDVYVYVYDVSDGQVWLNTQNLEKK